MEEQKKKSRERSLRSSAHFSVFPAIVHPTSQSKSSWSSSGEIWDGADAATETRTGMVIQSKSSCNGSGEIWDGADAARSGTGTGMASQSKSSCNGNSEIWDGATRSVTVGRCTGSRASNGNELTNLV